MSVSIMGNISVLFGADILQEAPEKEAALLSPTPKDPLNDPLDKGEAETPRHTPPKARERALAGCGFAGGAEATAAAGRRGRAGREGPRTCDSGRPGDPHDAKGEITQPWTAPNHQWKPQLGKLIAS